MPLEIIRNDITKMKVDAIVNAANTSLLGGGGVDGMIHKAAGEGLLAECKNLGGCETGKAKITGGYNLPAKFVIHTVGPIFKDGKQGEKALLESCYKESLALAKEYACQTVAFPLISSGIYGYPKDEALRVAIDVISEFVMKNDILVYIVVFDKSAYKINTRISSAIKAFIKDCYVKEHSEPRYGRNIDEFLYFHSPPVSSSSLMFCVHDVKSSNKMPKQKEIYEKTSLELELDAMLRAMDESFSQMLLRKIDEKGMTDAECYKKANIDRKLFSKIRKDVNYKPSKNTAIAFAIALELPLYEALDLLKKAGFTLSHSNKFDIIIEYFLINGTYNVFEINEVLFAFDQSLLGA